MPGIFKLGQDVNLQNTIKQPFLMPKDGRLQRGLRRITYALGIARSRRSSGGGRESVEPGSLSGSLGRIPCTLACFFRSVCMQQTSIPACDSAEKCPLHASSVAHSFFFFP